MICMECTISKKAFLGQMIIYVIVLCNTNVVIEVTARRASHLNINNEIQSKLSNVSFRAVELGPGGGGQ